MKKYFPSESKAKKFAETVNDPFIYKESVEAIGIGMYMSTPWCVVYDSIKMKKVYRANKVQLVPKYKEPK